MIQDLIDAAYDSGYYAAVLEKADLTDEQRAEYEALQREAIGRRRAIEARIRRPKEEA